MSVPSAPVVSDSATVSPTKRHTPPREALIAEPQSEIKLQPKAGKPLASNVPTGELDLKSMGSATTVKKAKCPKCKGLNVPSDWYCVHCGAELAI